jgi:cytoskeletal protein CcmA (bactofilin family)
MKRFSLFLFVLLALPSLTFASSVMRTGDNVSVASGQAVEGDFYSAASKVVISGDIVEDLLILGGTLNVNGQVGKDLTVLAGEVDISGTIGDDVRVVAGQVTISGEINGDLVVVADTLNVLSTAKISGDVLFFGTKADLSGEVGKSVFGTSESLRIDGVVNGDIDIKTSELTLGERTDIAGMVKYTSATELVRAQNARVSGKVLRNEPQVGEINSLKPIVIPFLVLIFAALVMYLLFGRLLERVSVQAVEFPFRSMLTGFGLFFLTPIAIGILVMSTLGSLIGVTLLFIYFGLMLVTFIISGVVAGSFLLNLTKKPNTANLLTVMIGTTVSFLLLFIPVVGPVVLFGLLFVTMGALTTYLYRIVRLS